MRWQQLFADLSAQFEEATSAEQRADVAARARTEAAAVTLADRLRGSVGGELALECRGAGWARGRLTDAGGDWALLDDDRGGELLVALTAVRVVSGLGRLTAAPEQGPVRSRLDLRRALRGLARDRSAVVVVLDDGAVLGGTVDRVGADFVELARHEPGEPRRASVVREVQAVAIEAIAVVRSSAP
jgi:hypothetical protein